MAQRDCTHGRLARACEICELQDEVAELEAKLTVCKNSKQILLQTIATQNLELERLRRGSESKFNGNC